jgi:hypothetical protein
VTSSKNPIDLRPFRSRVELEREQALEAQYRRLAIPEVVAAIRQVAGNQTSRPTDGDPVR